MKEIQPSVNDARLQAILDESRTREKQVSDTNRSIEALWHNLGELGEALHQFSCWREVLARDLKRRPSHDECCDRFELLVSELKTVVSQHGYEDFYQMIAESTAPNPEHHAACGILHQLLTSSNDESRTIINEIFGQDIPVCRYVFNALVPMLYGRWNTDYANIRRLPEIATLDDLGFVGDMRAEGFSLLMRARPDFTEFREQLRKYRPPTEYNPDEIQRFIDVLRADDDDLSQSLLTMPLPELARLFAAGRKRDQERARLDETQLNVPSNSESTDSASVTNDVQVANRDDGAVAIAELLKKLGVELSSLKSSQADTATQESLQRLLSVFSNGLADDRMAKARVVLENDKLNTNEKLTKIDTLMRFPATASAQQLANLLGVSKQAVMKTEWWKETRQGEKADEIGRRRATHKQRAERYEPPSRSDDEEWR